MRKVYTLKRKLIRALHVYWHGSWPIFDFVNLIAAHAYSTLVGGTKVTHARKHSLRAVLAPGRQNAHFHPASNFSSQSFSMFPFPASSSSSHVPYLLSYDSPCFSKTITPYRKLPFLYPLLIALNACRNASPSLPCTKAKAHSAGDCTRDQEMSLHTHTLSSSSVQNIPPRFSRRVRD